MLRFEVFLAILLNRYQRSIASEEKQLLLPNLQRMRESQVKKIIEDIKELGVRRFAMMNYGTLDSLLWEFMQALRELGYRITGMVQVLKKVTEETSLPNESYLKSGRSCFDFVAQSFSQTFTSLPDQIL